MNKIKLLSLGLILATSIQHGVIAQSASAQLNPSKSLAEVTTVLKQAHIPMDRLVQSPYQGLYQIIYKNETAYVDSTGQYLLIGDIYALDEIKQQNQGQLPTFERITPLESSRLNYAKLGTDLVILDQAQTFVMAGQIVRLSDQMNMTDLLQLEVNKVDWNKLPFDQAIKQVKGSGERKIVVFSDPHCPYCKQLEQTLAKMDNLTIYTFLYPLKPNAMKISEKIWCAKNPAQAWQDFMLKNREPQNSTANCKTPMQANLTLGEKWHIYGTPSLIFENGYMLMGALSQENIEQVFSVIQQESKK